jgi:hypothetical protein
MRMRRIQRKPRQLLLDGLFAVLVAHFLLTGTIVPTALVELFRDQPQIVVSTEPAHSPDGAPVLDEGDPLPETRSPVQNGMLDL